MADLVTFSSAAGPATAPHGTIVATDEVNIGGSTAHVQIVKIGDGTDGSSAMIAASSGGLLVNVNNASVPISGNSTAIISTASVIRVESTGTFPVTDNGGSLTIDGNSTAIISTASIIRVDTVASLPQSSVTIAGGQSTAIISTASKIVAELSTTGMGGSTASPMWVSMHPIPVATSTYFNVKLTSTTAAAALSSAGSTRFVILALDIVNEGATATEVSVYDGSTAGTLLYRQWASSAGGGISRPLLVPRYGSTGSSITVQCNPASTVYVTGDAYRSS